MRHWKKRVKYNEYKVKTFRNFFSIFCQIFVNFSSTFQILNYRNFSLLNIFVSYLVGCCKNMDVNMFFNFQFFCVQNRRYGPVNAWNANTPHKSIYFPLDSPKIRTVQYFLNFDILCVMTDIFYVEWIYLTSLDLYLHVLEQNHCFVLATPKLWISSVWSYKGGYKYAVNTSNYVPSKNFVTMSYVSSLVHWFAKYRKNRANMPFFWLLRSLKSFEQIIWRTINSVCMVKRLGRKVGSDVPSRKFYTRQFSLVRMKLRNHVDTQSVKRFKR